MIDLEIAEAVAREAVKQRRADLAKIARLRCVAIVSSAVAVACLIALFLGVR